MGFLRTGWNLNNCKALIFFAKTGPINCSQSFSSDMCFANRRDNQGLVGPINNDDQLLACSSFEMGKLMQVGGFFNKLGHAKSGFRKIAERAAEVIGIEAENVQNKVEG